MQLTHCVLKDKTHLDNDFSRLRLDIIRLRLDIIYRLWLDIIYRLNYKTFLTIKIRFCIIKQNQVILYKNWPLNSYTLKISINYIDLNT